MNGWESKKLSEICKVNYGQSPSLTLSDEGNIPVIGTGNEIRYGEKFLYDGESIILGRKGTIDNPIYVSGKFWAIDTAFYLSNFLDTDVKWLYYYLLSRKSYFVSEATGVPSISRSFLYDLGINTPPKKEQTTIAKILSTVDKAIEQTEKLIAKYHRIKTGLMQDLLTKGIDEHGNIRSEKTHKFKNSPLGRIPVEWEVISLGNEKYFSLATGGTPLTTKKEFWENGNIPWLSSGEIHKKIIFYTDNYITKRGYENSNARFYPINSILIALAGQGRTRGTIAITEIELTSNQSISAVIPQKSLIEPYYIYYYLDSLYEELRSISAGSGRASLSLSILSNLELKLPPKSEQKIITDKIIQIDSLLKKETEYKNKLISQKSGLMQDLLTGKVRVSQLLSKN